MKKLISLIHSLAVSLAEYTAEPEACQQLPLETAGRITAAELYQVIMDKLVPLGLEPDDLFLADNFSQLYQLAGVARLLGLDPTSSIKYIPELMDCDNFAGMIYGLMSRQPAFPGGVIQTDTHRLNWFVDENKKFWFIEPQTDQISEHLDGWQGVKILLVIS